MEGIQNITIYVGDDGVVKNPGYINKNKVAITIEITEEIRSKIGDKEILLPGNLFKNNYYISDLKIIDRVGIKIIGNDFLNECNGLRNIDLSELSNVTQIGEKFAWRCYNLTNINLSGLSNVTKI
jgi:hypothetical protein